MRPDHTTSTISMPSRITPQQYGQAVLEHVQNGAYPESEEVVSADFPPSALPEVSKLIEQAREDVKVCIYRSSTYASKPLITEIVEEYQEDQPGQRPGY